MPGSEHNDESQQRRRPSRDLRGGRLSYRTPTEQFVPDPMLVGGDCVFEQIVSPIHEGRLVPGRCSLEKRLNTGVPKYLGALSPGSSFKGNQNATGAHQDLTKSYPDVDLRESFLCGYLTIFDLTKDYPQLTTFFEGELIGPKHSFQTKKWAHCQPYLYSPGSCTYDFREHDTIFMRWKERFLVPDHHIENIQGASYEGFYYIGYDRIKRQIEGYYYHKTHNNELQKLLLGHVPSKASAYFEFC